MSEEIEKVSYDPQKTDMAGIKFTRGPKGHVYSPWFTYEYAGDLKAGQTFYGFNNRTAQIMNAARSAFSSVLGINVEHVVLTEMPSRGGTEIQWRLGTMYPCELPKPPSLPAPRVETIRKLGDDFIDIEATPVRAPNQKKLK